MQTRITKLKPIITQNYRNQDEQHYFMNPVSKKTFLALPKIYGQRKKKKLPVKHRCQQRIDTLRNQVISDIEERNSTKNVEPFLSVGENTQEPVEETRIKRFKTLMKTYDKKRALTLSQPKQQFCHRKYCLCHKEHFANPKNSLKGRQPRKLKSLNTKLSDLQHSLSPDDIQTKHKVVNSLKQRQVENNSRVSYNLLDLLRLTHQNNNHINKKLNNNNVNNFSTPRNSTFYKKQQILPQPVVSIATKNDVQVQTQSFLQKNETIIPQIHTLATKQYQSNKTSRNDRYKPQVSPIQSLNSQEQNAQKQQKGDTFLADRLKLQQMRKKYEKLHEHIDSDNQSQTSTISTASLSKKIFSNSNGDKQSTVFHRLLKKQQNPDSFGQTDNQSQTYSNKLQTKSQVKSVVQKKNTNLYTIPEEQQYVEYLKAYKPMNEHFKLKKLVKKDNFKVFKNQDGVYFGQIKNSSKNGQGLMISQKLIFQGDFQDNEKVYGCQKNIDGIFKGEFVKGVREGYGKFDWNNGETFQGEWKGGKKNGFGIWKSQKGDYYEGQWRANRQHGKGIYRHKLSTYKGYFSDFLKSGQGQQLFINGDKFVGSYKQGKPHGFGKYVWENGSYYEGNFVNGIREGQGIWRQISGTIYQGQFKNDFKNGHGIQKNISGQIYEGQFANGQKVFKPKQQHLYQQTQTNQNA